MLLNVFLTIVIGLHGLIHFMGFAKAYNYAEISALTQPINKTSGFLWLTAAFLFLISSLLLLFKIDFWWFIAIIGVIISQYLIIQVWQDAKFGTIANLIIIIFIVLTFIGKYKLT